MKFCVYRGCGASRDTTGCADTILIFETERNIKYILLFEYWTAILTTNVNQCLHPCIYKFNTVSTNSAPGESKRTLCTQNLFQSTNGHCIAIKVALPDSAACSTTQVLIFYSCNMPDKMNSITVLPQYCTNISAQLTFWNNFKLYAK